MSADGLIAGHDGGRLANINLDQDAISITVSNFYVGDGIGHGRISMTVGTLMSASLSDPQLEEKLHEVMQALAVKDMIQSTQLSIDCLVGFPGYKA